MSKTQVYSSDTFTLAISQHEKYVELCMEVFGVVNTKSLPFTHSFLSDQFPSVLKTECFNDYNLPFDEEVKMTEIGHLFEHMVLDELCALEVKQGEKSVTHEGVTSWNWVIENEGVFHITIDSPFASDTFLHGAVKKAIDALEKLFEYHRFSGQPCSIAR